MKKNGFTFIELLVVITIMGVIFASGIAAYTTISKNSRNARRSADLEAIRQALEMCRSIDGEYPAAIYDSITCPVSSPPVVTLKSTKRDPKPCEGFDDEYTYVLDASGYTLTANCYEGGPVSVTNP
ncbi:MAG TPA: type II secretion system protein [Spirochaetia bacterium]|nr:type II secretion system protein [Spirochaetia bacterium]